MFKGKHNTSFTQNSRIRKILIFILCFFILIAICYFVHFFINKFKDTSTQVSNFNISQINTSKYVSGLESLKIQKIEIQNSSTSSIIEVFFSNVSTTKITASKVHLYLLNDNGNTVFGSTLKLPDIAANSHTSIRVICSSNLENVSDYKIVLE